MAKSARNDGAATAEPAEAEALPESYEAALAELDGLVARMEGGSLSLEDSLAAYRRGATLVRFCQQQLEKVEQQVRVLDGETLRPVPLNTTDSAAGGDDDL
ncbi:exodeoxyribonuclease VII small subunit [Paraburkholderia acidisoli]|jgi:exodeoxyribonuclease VII small subunit|uniref:Exodeoxyribonuclease 7 small subunit n=1 Tax=Paraburkholderia acidisoli TaxID=2571748 RepID=A0A7Z2GKT0_9BURK|nr:exodeoxyribonuclease VII small subunit [Paraburkholderia acidisoli]QGZ63630.1 exodeoxyribonuclease VII small subunit [Paraburkholderia acidisoli]